MTAMIVRARSITKAPNASLHTNLLYTDGYGHPTGLSLPTSTEQGLTISREMVPTIPSGIVGALIVQRTQAFKGFGYAQPFDAETGARVTYVEREQVYDEQAAIYYNSGQRPTEPTTDVLFMAEQQLMAARVTTYSSGLVSGIFRHAVCQTMGLMRVENSLLEQERCQLRSEGDPRPPGAALAHRVFGMGAPKMGGCR